jgi:hypothetical protein
MKRYFKLVSKAGGADPDKIMYVERSDDAVVLVREKRIQLDRVFGPSISTSTINHFDTHLFKTVNSEITKELFYKKFDEVSNILRNYNNN